MKMYSDVLLGNLILDIKKIISEVEDIKGLSIDQLTAKFDAESWSILECFEHLNLYGLYYLPEISKRINN